MRPATVPWWRKLFPLSERCKVPDPVRTTVPGGIESEFSMSLLLPLSTSVSVLVFVRPSFDVLFAFRLPKKLLEVEPPLAALGESWLLIVLL